MVRLLALLLLSACSGYNCQDWEKTDWKPEPVESGCIGIITRHGGAIISEGECPYEQSCTLTKPENWGGNGLAYYRTSSGPSAPTVVLVPDCVASSCEDLDLILLNSRN